jgi:translation initiation factor 1
MAEVAHKLKERLATGGTSKEGVIMLQGDHRARIKGELVKLGFPEDHIEVF